MQKIVCAALRGKDGTILCSARHFDKIMVGIIDKDIDDTRWINPDQGFIDQYGTFLDREEAYTVAFKAMQILYRVCGDNNTLYSENLY